MRTLLDFLSTLAPLGYAGIIEGSIGGTDGFCRAMTFLCCVHRSKVDLSEDERVGFVDCLHFNWQVAWDPDDWGLDMDLSPEMEAGREELWTYRMLYLVARITNYRAMIPRLHQTSPHDEQMRLQNRYIEWKSLKDLCDAWNDGIPRTMHPMAYLYPYQTPSKSAFPEVWLLKRTTIVARLFYHTAMCLLARVNPIMSVDTDEMKVLQHHHSQQICGIVAHVKDR